jgi:hypothetical protein
MNRGSKNARSKKLLGVLVVLPPPEAGRKMRLRLKIASVYTQFDRRARQFRDLLAAEGPRGIVTRMRRRTAETIAPRQPLMPVLCSDVLAADLSRPCQSVVPRLDPGEPVVLNWVTIPAGPRSGGHTTMYRMIRYLEGRGYSNRIYFYNVYRADTRYYESIARDFYGFHGPISTTDEGMADAHAVVATSWPTAYPVFNSPCKGKRFYFVQDFEPYFYPTGTLSLLAENTYRMGFHAITAGKWLASKLVAEFGMTAQFFDFGSDSARYYLIPGVKRSGIVFYARPEAARRGFELGLMAVELFAKARPDIEIHFYGERMGKLPFAFVDHGKVTPDELNLIYNRCYAGLSLSLTNVSLVPHEMLAAGCIPIVNDAVHNRMVLNSPLVRYVPPYPQALAYGMLDVVDNPDFDSLSQTASASVQSTSWESAGTMVDAIFRRTLSTNVETVASEPVIGSCS